MRDRGQIRSERDSSGRSSSGRGGGRRGLSRTGEGGRLPAQDWAQGREEEGLVFCANRRK